MAGWLAGWLTYCAAVTQQSDTRPTVDRTMRDSERPFVDSWLEEFTWAFVDECGYVRCSACVSARKATDLGTKGGKPVSAYWRRNQLAQHAEGQKHRDAMKACQGTIGY